MRVYATWVVAGYCMLLYMQLRISQTVVLYWIVECILLYLLVLSELQLLPFESSPRVPRSCGQGAQREIIAIVEGTCETLLALLSNIQSVLSA
jgi:hypothetical protein